MIRAKTKDGKGRYGMSDLIELKTLHARASTFSRVRILLVAGIAALGLVACGGGGDGDGNSAGGPSDPGASDNIPTTTSLGGLYELTGDAGRDYRLFYVDASHYSDTGSIGNVADPWLMAYNPLTENTETIDKKYARDTSRINAVSPLALHEADVDVSSGEVENYRVASVTYIQEDTPPPSLPIASPTKLMRVGVAAGSTPEQVTNESGPSADLGFVTVRQIITFNLNDANQAQYVFPSGASTTSNRQYRLTPLDADTSTSAKDFGAGLNVQTALFATQGSAAGSAYGWLVVDQNQNDCLAFVSGSDLTNATCIPNVNSTGNVPLEQNGDNPSSFISGVYPLNNGVVLALPADTSNPLRVTTTLWFYEQSPGSGDAGTLHLLKNAGGDTLQTTGLPMFGPDEAGRVVSKNGNTLYLAASDGGLGGLFGGGAPSDPFDMEFHAFLFKITTTSGNVGWEQVIHQGDKLLDDKAAFLGGFLVDAGSNLIWEINDRLIAISPDGQSEILLDGRSNDGGDVLLGTGAFKTPVGAISQGGWFFYNRELNSAQYATAIKVDGSKRVELKGCSWIGASTSGKANYTGGNFGSLEPSEVFMACNNKQLAAVDANNPEAGRVVLGNLAKPAENIAMGRAAPGPHRLMQVTYEGDEDSFEVVYVNTREKNSLKHLMNNPASDSEVGALAGMTAPVDGF
jgi:hypothetical protein